MESPLFVLSTFKEAFFSVRCEWTHSHLKCFRVFFFIIFKIISSKQEMKEEFRIHSWYFYNILHQKRNYLYSRMNVSASWSTKRHFIWHICDVSRVQPFTCSHENVCICVTRTYQCLRSEGKRVSQPMSLLMYLLFLWKTASINRTVQLKYVKWHKTVREHEFGSLNMYILLQSKRAIKNNNNERKNIPKNWNTLRLWVCCWIEEN